MAVRGRAHVVGHHVDIVEILHGVGPVDILGAGRGGEGDDLVRSQGLAEFLEDQIEIIGVVGIGAGLIVGALGRILPVDVDAVHLVGFEQLLDALAEFRALGRALGHLGEAVGVTAPAADHQADLQFGVNALEGNDLADGCLLGLGNHDAAVTGLGIDETAVGIVDMGQQLDIGERLGVLGEVRQDDRGLADVRAMGAVGFRRIGRIRRVCRVRRIGGIRRVVRTGRRRSGKLIFVRIVLGAGAQRERHGGGRDNQQDGQKLFYHNI